MIDPLNPNDAFDILRLLSSGSNVPAEVCEQLAKYVEDLECEVNWLKGELEKRRAA